MQDLAGPARGWWDTTLDNPVLYRERGPWRRRGQRVLLAAGAATGAAWALGLWWRAQARPDVPGSHQLVQPYTLFGLVLFVVLPLLLAVLAVVALRRDLRAGNWELVQLSALSARRFITGHLLRILLRFPAWAFVLPLAPLHALALINPVRGLPAMQDAFGLSVYAVAHTLNLALALFSGAAIGLQSATTHRGTFVALGDAVATVLFTHGLINGLWLWAVPAVAWYVNPANFYPVEILLVAYHGFWLCLGWISAAKGLATIV